MKQQGTCLLLVGILISQTCAITQIQESVGAISRTIDPVYFQAAHWRGHFIIKLPCIDETFPQTIPAMVRDMQASMKASVKTIHSVMVDLGQNKSTIAEGQIAMIAQQHELVKTLIKQVSVDYSYIRREGETIFGNLPQSMCSDKGVQSDHQSIDIDYDDTIHQLQVVSSTYRSPPSTPSQSHSPVGMTSTSTTTNKPSSTTTVRATPPNLVKKPVSTSYKKFVEAVKKRTKREEEMVTNNYDLSQSVNSTIHNTFHLHSNCTTESQRSPMANHRLPMGSQSSVVGVQDEFKGEHELAGDSPMNEKLMERIDHKLGPMQQVLDLLDSMEADGGRRIRGTESELSLRELLVLRNCTRRCGHSYHVALHDLTPEIINALLTASSPLPRVRRGLFDFMGDLWNKLFGIATEGQLNDIKKLMDTLKEATSTTQAEVISMREEQASGMLILQETLSKTAKHTDERFKNLTAQLNGWVDHMAATSLALDDTVKQVMLLERVVMVIESMNRYTSMLQFILTIQEKIKTNYLQVKKAINNDEFPFALIPSEHVAAMFRNIRENIPIEYGLPIGQTGQSILANIPVAGHINKNFLAISFNVPILESPTTMQVWAIQGLPLLLGGQWFQPVVEDSVMIIDRAVNTWQPLPPTELLACRSNKLSICPFQPSWRINQDLTCSATIVIDAAKVKDVCFLTVGNNEKYEGIYSAALSDNEWLISRGKSTLFGTLSCITEAGQSKSNREVEVPTYGKVSVPAGCTMTLGPVKLNPKSFQLGATAVNIDEVGESITFKTPVVTDLHSSLPKLNIKQLLPVKLELPPSESIVEAGGIKIANLMKDAASKTRIYTDKMEYLSQQYKDLKQRSDGYGDGGWQGSGILSNWLFSTHSLITVVLVIWCIILTRMVLQQRAVRAASSAFTGALPLVSHIPGSFAMPLVTVAPSEMKSFESITHKHGVRFMCNVTVMEKNLDEIRKALNTQFDPRLYMVVMTVIMIGMSLLCMWHNRKVMHQLHIRTRDKLGYIPVNRAAIHHAGENKVIITFLLEFTSAITSRRTTQTQQAQICTLPGSASQWTCHVEDATKSFFLPSRNTRWSTHKLFKVQWGGLCLRSPEFAALNTCAELPILLNLKSYEVTRGITSRLPWFWTHVNVLAVTALSISGPGYFYDLYQYHSS